MLPYTVIKEANRPEHSGTATGVINFINFSLSALLGPVFASLLIAGRAAAASASSPTIRRRSSRCSTASALAILLALFLRETGRRGRAAPAPPTAADRPGGR